MSSVLASPLTRLALAFVLGAASAVLIATLWSSDGPAGEAVGRWLDAVDDHKDDILALITVTAIIARSVIVPHSDWVSMIESGNLIWLVVATGTGVGLSRAGKGVKLKLESDNSTSQG